MSSSFERLKHIDQSVKDLVCGYIRTVAGSDSVPPLSDSTCLLFYHIAEYFTVIGKGVHFDEKTQTLQSQELENCTTYGHVAIQVRPVEVCRDVSDFVVEVCVKR